ncbi:hypothetical protein [Limnobacter parvus]|uniref:Uncharacterized protein n=1 Tax=Limnobacter parvus TaxID=2939690 RepID=A0ABT1XDA3_9BURK|nr:hypothetical protein [Limnobacter parvus]MCR2745258.1 hypothetical protein [Limnobacter parvus]
MMTILNAKLVKNKLTWQSNSITCQVDVEGIDQFLVDESKDLVFVLTGVGSKELASTSLFIYDQSGQQLKINTNLPGHLYSHLVKNPRFGVTVVAQFQETYQGRYDWQLGLAEDGQLLIAVCPAM